MPSWFSKVFKKDEPPAPEPVEKKPLTFDDDDDFDDDDTPARAPIRKLVEPIVLDDGTREEAAPVETGGIRIKAAVADDMQSCKLMVDRPVFEGHSVYAHSPESAAEVSPLAEALFALEGISQVEIHNMNVTLTRHYRSDEWEEAAREAGAIVRGWLEAGKPVVNAQFLEDLPSPEEITEKLEVVIDTEINPGIAAHSGAIALKRVEGNTVYINMMGGCQGCAASDITLKVGIHQAFRDAVPQIGAILDETDHSAGTNPFYTSLPAGMQ
jgi:Fe-S cluster biogenesis protein NfuA